MAEATDHFFLVKDPLSTVSNVITIITGVIGFATLLIWWFSNVPGEVDMFRKEANETKEELEQFLAYWTDLEDTDPDCAADNDTQGMIIKINEIVGQLQGVLPSGDSRRRWTSMIDKIAAWFRKLRKEVSSDTSADAETQDAPKQHDTTSKPRSRWAWFWTWVWKSNELQSRVAHARNLKYQLMFSYLHLLVKKNIGLNAQVSFNQVPRDNDDDAGSAHHASQQKTESTVEDTDEQQDLGLEDLFGNGAAVDGHDDDDDDDMNHGPAKAHPTRGDDDSHQTCPATAEGVEEAIPATAV